MTRKQARREPTRTARYIHIPRHEPARNTLGLSAKMEGFAPHLFHIFFVREAAVSIATNRRFIHLNLGSAAPSGFKVGARRNRASVLKPPGAAGLTVRYFVNIYLFSGRPPVLSVAIEL